jgi:tRNA U34 2-thiouridine synthase MnmA/TrmU
MGLSGGIDSSFLAALLYSRRIPYLGFCLPIASNTPEEIERGTRVAEAYACRQRACPSAHKQDFTDVYKRISGAFSAIIQAYPRGRGQPQGPHAHAFPVPRGPAATAAASCPRTSSTNC